jgi:hypothetical protein
VKLSTRWILLLERSAMSRPRAKALIIVAAIPALLLGVGSIFAQLPQFGNPCVTWGAGDNATAVLTRDDACTQRTVVGETKQTAAVRIVLVPGVLLLGAVLGIWGTLRKSWKLSLISGSLLLLEAIPLALTVWPLPLLAGGAFLWAAAEDRHPQR